MKKLIIINGTMGVGKSTVSNILLKSLKPSVYLDGDWCWNMNPFEVTEQNKAMVMDNITYLLNNFLKNPQYEYIIFCWVIHQEDIFEQIINRLNSGGYKLYKVTLVCSKQALCERLQKDIESGKRQPDIIERSAARLELYRNMNTYKIDVSGITAEQAAGQIIKIITA